jgi:hypothetical protein
VGVPIVSDLGSNQVKPRKGSHTDGQGEDDLEIPGVPKRPSFDRRKDGGAHQPKDEQARERPSQVVAFGQEFVPRGDLVDELDLVGQGIIRAGVLGSQLGRPVDSGSPEVLPALRSLAKVPDDDADFVGELGDGDDRELRGRFSPAWDQIRCSRRFVRVEHCNSREGARSWKRLLSVPDHQIRWSCRVEREESVQ